VDVLICISNMVYKDLIINTLINFNLKTKFDVRKPK
jgi:hypothetical protein